MASDPEKFEKIKKLVRAIIQPNKAGLPASKLAYEYRELSGDKLPVRELGFPNVEAFIVAMPDTVRVQRSGGEVILHAIADESTAHIDRMVSRQKSNKKRTKGHTKFRRPAPRSYVPHRLHTSSYYPGSHYSKPAPGRTAFSSKSRGQPFSSNMPQTTSKPFQPSSKPAFRQNSSQSWSQETSSKGVNRGFSSSSYRSSQTPSPLLSRLSPSPARTSPPPSSDRASISRETSSTSSSSSRPSFSSNAPRMNRSSPAFSAITQVAKAGVEGREQSFKKREVSATSAGSFTVTVQTTPPPASSKGKYGQGFEVPPRFRKQQEQENAVQPPPSDARPPSSVQQSSPPETLPTVTPASSVSITPIKQFRKPRATTSPHFKPCTEIIFFEDQADSSRKRLHEGAMNNYMQVLERFLAKDSIELDFQTIPTGKDTNSGYASSLKIRGKVYGSLGIFSTPQRAELFVAKNACESLGLLENEDPAAPVKPAEEIQITEKMLTDFEKMIKERIKELVNCRQNGVWEERLPIEYKNKFGEEPPEDLSSLIKDWPDIIKIESYAQTDRKICYPVVPKPEAKPVTPTPVSKTEATAAVNTPRQPTPPPTARVPTTIPTARVPNVGEEVEVYLVSIIDCSEFYVHIENMNNITELMKKLEAACKKQKNSGDVLHTVNEGKFYAALYEDDWYRVQVISIEEDNITVLYLDFGNMEVVTKSDMMNLDPALYDYPAQTVRCSLDAVYKRKAENWDRATEELRTLESVGNTYQIKVISHENDGCSVEFFPGSARKSLNETLVKKGLVGNTKKIKATDPTDLVLPKDDWDVIVTFVYSPTRVVVRLVGEEYSEKLEQLEEVIAELNDIGESDEELKVGDLCVARIEESTVEGEIPWYRVRILEIENDTAKVEYLDYGDTEYLSLSDVRLMTPEENTLPYQAFAVALYGLETSEGEEVIRMLQEKLVSPNAKPLVADIVSHADDKIWVTLWDTSTDIDINVNEQIMEVMDSREFAPQLPAEQETAECFVSHITQEGHVYLQMKGPGLTMMEKLSQEITSHLDTAGASSCIREPKVGSRVLGLYADAWYRAEIVEVFAENRKVEVFFIDYGNSEIIPCSSLRVLKPVSKQFYRLPPQAMKCILDGLPKYGVWTEAALNSLEEVASDDMLMRVEVIEPPTEKKCAIIDLYYLEEAEDGYKMQGVREALTEDDAIWEVASSASDTVEKNGPTANTELPENQELPDTTDDEDEDFDKTPEDLDDVFEQVELLSLKSQPESVRVGPDGAEHNSDEEHRRSPSVAGSISSLTGTDRFGMPLPGKVEMPKSGDQVMVTLASNPQDFKVIPCAYLDTLQTMMTDMCVFYTSEETVLEVEMVKKVEAGDVCAAYNEDSVWYRVQISEVISQSLVKVLFLDYGDFNVLSIVDLRVLPKQFRIMPFLVIKSLLTGVSPVGSSWVPEDILRFTELVMEKQLHTIIANIDSMTETLSMTLIDNTQQGEDALIHKVLIREGFAISTQQSRRNSENNS